MRDIQDDTKPIMTRLALGKWWTLNRDAQAALATWVCCGTITSEFDTPENVAIPKKERDYLRTNLRPPPDTWRIWIGQFKGPRWPGFFAHLPMEILADSSELEEAEGRAPDFNTVSASYLIGQTYIHVFRCPYPEIVARWHFSPRVESRLIQIWPISHFLITWPPADALSESDLSGATNAFFRFAIDSAKARRGQ